MGTSNKRTWKSKIEELARENILNAAIELLKTEGIQKLTMDNIAQKAGIAKGTLYLYFAKKETLLNEAINQTFTPLHNDLISILKSDLPPDTKLKEFIFCNISFFNNNIELMHLFRELMIKFPVKRKHYCMEERYSAIISALTDVFRDGINQGIFKKINPANGAAIFFEAKNGILIQRFKNKTEGVVNEDADELISILFTGLLKDQNSHT